MNQLKRIALVSTGGTIAGQHADHTATANYEIATEPQSLLDALPQIKDLAQIECHPILQIDSSTIQPAEQVKIVTQTNLLLARADIDAVVITHGTDTLEETATLLHLCIKSNKPVVLVGAMRPGSALSADGPLNLYQAVLVATHADAHNLGVLVVTNDQIHSARFIRKMHTNRPDAFASPDTGPLGVISNGIIYIGCTPRRAHGSHSEFSLDKHSQLPNVDILYDHPNTNLGFYRSCIEQQRDGLIIAGTGNGNLSPIAQQGALKLHQAGIPVVRASQVGAGPVVPTFLDEKFHTLAAHWWSPHGARILLSLCLKEQFDRQHTQHVFRHY